MRARRYLDRVDRTTDPSAWGAAQQEIGRALTALGEREGARDKLEEGVARLRHRHGRAALDGFAAASRNGAARAATRGKHAAATPPRRPALADLKLGPQAFAINKVKGCRSSSPRSAFMYIEPIATAVPCFLFFTTPLSS